MQLNQRRGRFSAGRVSATTVPWIAQAGDSYNNRGESSTSSTPAGQASAARETAIQTIDYAESSQASRTPPRQFVDDEPPEFQSDGSPDSQSSSLPGYTQTKDLLIPLICKSTTTSMLIAPPGVNIDDHGRAVEVAADTAFETSLARQRNLERVTYADFHSWPEWLASVRRLNILRRHRRENGESAEMSEWRTDAPFAFAFGPRPAAAEPGPPPPRATFEDWDEWLDSEERWGSIWMHILDGDSPQRAGERADEDHEDFIGRRPYYLPLTYLHEKTPVPRPVQGSEDYLRHQSYRDAFAAAGASLDKIEEIFSGFYLEDGQSTEF
ncbi:hypothetical protein BKA65DRAFT_569172 [Rhexocercosporidium sp. MPI-PUGE-AT-0058]|nr:hypothetical protein BKA65DRAFT_569172 [Rhexocercosporidium sp. MPI-PUGE-AT-0058]